MKRVATKVFSIAISLIMATAFFQFPKTTHAADPTRPAIYFNEYNQLSHIDLRWDMGNTTLYLSLKNENPSAEWNDQKWIIWGIGAKSAQQSVIAQDPTKAEQGLAHSKIVESLRGYGDDDGGYADFQVEIDMDGGDTYDVPLKFQVRLPQADGKVTHADTGGNIEERKWTGYFRRTDGNTNAKIKENYIKSNTSSKKAGALSVFPADTDNTEIHFGVRDETAFRINGYDRWGRNDLAITLDKAKLLQSRTESNEALPFACKKKSTGELVCTKDENDCVKVNDGSSAGGDCSKKAPPEICQAGKGCVSVETQATPTPSSSQVNIAGNLSNVTVKDIVLTNPLKFTTAQEIIVSVINLILSIAAFAAIIMIIFGGYQYMASTGDQAKVEGARKTLTNAIIGLVIVILSYIILNTVTALLTGGSTSGTTSTTGTITGQSSSTGTASSVIPQSQGPTGGQFKKPAASTTAPTTSTQPATVPAQPTGDPTDAQCDTAYQEKIKSDESADEQTTCKSILNGKCELHMSTRKCLSVASYCREYCVEGTQAATNQPGTTCTKEGCEYYEEIRSRCSWSSTACVPK